VEVVFIRTGDLFIGVEAIAGIGVDPQVLNPGDNPSLFKLNCVKKIIQ